MLPSTLKTATSLPATVKQLPVPGTPGRALRPRQNQPLRGLQSAFPRPLTLKFLGQDWHAEIASLDALNDAKLQHFHDLLHGRACFERSLDVAASASRAWAPCRNPLCRLVQAQDAPETGAGPWGRP